MLLHTQIFGTSSPECENTSIYCIMSDLGENDDKVSKIYAECKIVTTILWILRLSILHCTVSNALFHLDHTESYADILYSSTEIKWWQISKKYQAMRGEKKKHWFLLHAILTYCMTTWRKFSQSFGDLCTVRPVRRVKAAARCRGALLVTCVWGKEPSCPDRADNELFTGERHQTCHY